jgi:hypothetical protein
MRTLAGLLFFVPLCALGFLVWCALLLAALLECAGILLRRAADAGGDWLSGVTL